MHSNKRSLKRVGIIGIQACQEPDDKMKMIIRSNSLHSTIASYFPKEDQFFRILSDKDKLLRYTDGTFSSMKKNSKGRINKHSGFKPVDMKYIHQRIASDLVSHFYSQLTEICSNNIKQIVQIIDFIQHYLFIPSISKLKAISEYIEEISKDISNVLKSEIRTFSAYCSIEKNTIKLREVFYTSLNYLEDLFNRGRDADLEDIAEKYVVCRCALHSFIVCQKLKNILSRNSEHESMDTLRDTITKVLEDINRVTKDTRKFLSRRQGINKRNMLHIEVSVFMWGFNNICECMVANRLYDCNIHDNEDIHSIQQEYLNDIDIDIDKERQKLEEFIHFSKNALDNIGVTQEVENK